MKNKPDFNALFEGENFQLLHKLQYDNILNFVFKNIKKNNLPAISYFVTLIILLVLIMIFSFYGFSSSNIKMGNYFLMFFCGFMAGSFVIIPFHEIFHLLAYLILGAKKPKIGMDLKQMIFYVVADKFVLNRREFSFVALSPFVIINIISALIFIFSGINLQIAILYFLIFHNIMCIGDFAMLSFFRQNKNKCLYTFDIIDEKNSYIFEKINY